MPAWLISPDDFNKIYNAIGEGDSVVLSLVNDESVVLAGQVPNADSNDVVFGLIRANSVTHTYLSAAWNHNQISYLFTVNGIIFAFCTPLGWAFVPPSHYITGRLPTGFPGAYELASGVVKNVLSPGMDSD